MVQEPPERYWTSASIDTLTKRLNLPNGPDMQDWAYQVADASRIDEFTSAFREFDSDADVRYTLMDVLIQSFEEIDGDLRTNNNWQTLLAWLERDFETHAYQVWYWSGFDSLENDNWRVAVFMREIWHRKKSAI